MSWRATSKQMALFGAIGVMNTLLDFGLYAVLTEVAAVDPLPSNVISYTVAGLNSYLLNCLITFRSAINQPRQILRFAMVTILCLGLSTAVLAAALPFVPSLAAKAASILLTFVFGYALNRFWAFKAEP